jgi:rifampin ADP-ribosylating transferase
MTETGARTFYHGTKAELKPGDMLQGGYSSNYTERRSPWIYFSETVFAATWGAELAKGEGPGRIYVVEPTGPFMDDPNVTDRKFPGNPILKWLPATNLNIQPNAGLPIDCFHRAR